MRSSSLDKAILARECMWIDCAAIKIESYDGIDPIEKIVSLD